MHSLHCCNFTIVVHWRSTTYCNKLDIKSSAKYHNKCMRKNLILKRTGAFILLIANCHVSASEPSFQQNTEILLYFSLDWALQFDWKLKPITQCASTTLKEKLYVVRSGLISVMSLFLYLLLLLEINKNPLLTTFCEEPRSDFCL